VGVSTAECTPMSCKFAVEVLMLNAPDRPTGGRIQNGR